MFLTEFRTQKYTGGIISRVGIFLTVTPAVVREPYVPIVEDITIEDDVVLNAVNKIESE